MKNRKAVFAGQFYPGEREELTNQLQQLFKKAQSPSIKNNQLQAIISPHAGYIFSGEVAASAFNQITKEANYKRVFVLASSHQYSFTGASIYCDGNYETPLGEIKVDIKLADQLIKSSNIFINKPEAHQNEHSLEVQLPFLQHKLSNNFQLVPIILGTNNANDCKKIASALKPWFTPENLFVISTDFSHYPEYNNAIDIDNKTANTICSNQPEQLQTVINGNRKEIDNLTTSLCGWTSVLTLLYLTGNSNSFFEKIRYKNSGDSKIHGDKNQVVGYWAIAVYNDINLFEISEKEKKEILDKTHHSIKTFLKKGEKGTIIQPYSTSGILNEIMGTFVSVYIKGELRGCIGSFAQEKKLNELVQEMAVSAVCDGRFENIKAEELKDMELEISVLSPLKKIESPNEIKLGKHGIFIQQELNSGTFLPQVIKKTGWDTKQFLGHCAQDKAGIGWDGWETADIYIYEAVVFREV